MPDRYAKTDEEFRAERLGGAGTAGTPVTYPTVDQFAIEAEAMRRADNVILMDTSKIRALDRGGHESMAYGDSMGTVHIDECHCTGETGKAIRVLSTAWRGPVHFPKKMLRPESDVKKTNDVGTLAVTYWICKKKGIVDIEGAAPPPPMPPIAATLSTPDPTKPVVLPPEWAEWLAKKS